MELQVEIRKQFKGFRLEVAFQAGDKTLGVLGPSGSGKSMTLRCIAGLDTPSWGRIVLNGRTLFDSKRSINLPSRARRVGFLLQDYALFPHMTVAENVKFGLHHLPRSEARRRVEAQIARVQLEGLEGRFPRQLSGGQQQRAALARALATQPEALLLDEPLSALDVYLRSQMETLLVETLGAYKGVSLYVSHNLEEVYRVSEDIVVISEGKEVAFGPKDEVFRHPPGFTVAQVTGCKNFSRAKAISSDCIEALDWGCALRVWSSIPQDLQHIGIRAHHLEIFAAPDGFNAFPCELVRVIEGPFRMTLYLRLSMPGAPPSHHHLQAEITREVWAGLKTHPFPWNVRLAPERIMLLAKDSGPGGADGK
ncbi:MAG TPA: sulfate/molybdate ABC transporter ATP-binding protein [Terriglobia bacterium]|nr:sulfate/molybdate ABC transporter ATP-binding protein [Terriglobia bacterium]